MYNFKLFYVLIYNELEHPGSTFQNKRGYQRGSSTLGKLLGIFKPTNLRLVNREALLVSLELTY